MKTETKPQHTEVKTMKTYNCDKCVNQELTFMGMYGKLEWYQCDKCGVDMTREANSHVAEPFNAILNRFSEVA